MSAPLVPSLARVPHVGRSGSDGPDRARSAGYRTETDRFATLLALVGVDLQRTVHFLRDDLVQLRRRIDLASIHLTIFIH
jgi:hypothetical protein